MVGVIVDDAGDGVALWSGSSSLLVDNSGARSSC